MSLEVAGSVADRPTRPGYRNAMTFAEWLRALPAAGPDLPDVELDALPDEPIALVRDRLERAAAAGVPAPHAMTLATSDRAGEVSARTVILKDATAGGLRFATHADSYKARQLQVNPRAALTFCWPALGDQIRVWGPVRDLGDEASAADFLARSEFSRATCVTGHQGDELDDLATHRSAWAAALEWVRANPGAVDPHWRAYGLRPAGVEWWHTSGAGQVRVAYQRADGGTWRRFLRWP